MDKYKILVVDDNLDLQEIILKNLTEEGFDVAVANDADEGISKAREYKPDLIIMDVMLPEMDGFQATDILKKDRATADIPVVFLSARDQVSDKVRGLNMGGIDYIGKPFKSQVLAARIRSLLRSRDHDISLNPLSMLPGNKVIEKYLHELILSKSIFSVGYSDIDNFKAYNDKYGFYAGDEVLRFVSKIIDDSVREHGRQDDFVGHIGGDDFVFVTGIDSVEKVCEQIVSDFDAKITDFYSVEDVRTGFVESVSRTGLKRIVPLMTLSVVVITNQNRNIEHPGEVAEIAAEMKAYLKNFSGSNYKIDRRTTEPLLAASRAQKKIIIIEPNNRITQRFDKVLNEKKVFVRYVDNGASALLLIDSIQPDLIIMNARLPLIDGATLYQEIKKNEDFSEIPVYCYVEGSGMQNLAKYEDMIPREFMLDFESIEESLKALI